MAINKKWYWAAGTLVVLGVSFLYRHKAMELWRRTMSRRHPAPATEP